MLTSRFDDIRLVTNLIDQLLSAESKACRRPGYAVQLYSLGIGRGTSSATSHMRSEVVDL
jgi:hypothetical protein